MHTTAPRMRYFCWDLSVVVGKDEIAKLFLSHISIPIRKTHLSPNRCLGMW